MTGARGVMHRILIEWFHRDRQVPAGSGPPKNPEPIESAIDGLRPFMRTMQVQLDFREVMLTGEAAQGTDMVKVNGKEVERRIDAADLTGALVDAVLKESARFARWGCGCGPEDMSR